MPDQTLEPDETVIADLTLDDHGKTRLIVATDVPTTDDGKLSIKFSELNSEPGLVRFYVTDPVDDEDLPPNDMEFDRFADARVAFGLWVACGPFAQPEGSAVPLAVARRGQDYITAYYYLNNGIPRPRAAVARQFDIAKQTVSDRLRRVRWTPEQEANR